MSQRIPAARELSISLAKTKTPNAPLNYQNFQMFIILHDSNTMRFNLITKYSLTIICFIISVIFGQLA